MTDLGRNCFPVRSLTRSNGASATTDQDIGGAWLVAYKAEQRRRFKAVLCCDPEIPSSQKSLTSKQRLKSTSQDETTRTKLDGFYLMNLLHVNDPLDLCSINICGKGLTQVNEDDFSSFKNVMHIDAGENNLHLIHFAKFSNLRELELPLNDLGGNIHLGENDFSWLEKLDLSYNDLTNNDIMELGILPELKQLHLTGNHLKQLPFEMSRSYSDNEGHRKARFSKLEKLWLDQNDLIESNTFSCLAGLKRLKYLNLEHNKISCVPSLRLLDTNNQMRSETIDYSLSDEGDEELRKQQAANVADKMIDDELNNVNEQISNLKDILYNNNQYTTMNNQAMNEKTFTFYYDSFVQESQQLPFLSLEHLILANNCLENEESLLALSTWPSLKELVIWGNPVASCGKGGPSVVNYRLGRIAGINVSRHKPSPKSKNMASLQLSKNPRKVDDLPPVVRNKKLLMLEQPKYPEITYPKSNDVKPLPPITAPCRKRKQQLEPTPKRSSSAPAGRRDPKHNSAQSQPSSNTPTTKQSDDVPLSEDRVFLTQVDDNDDILFFDDDALKQPTYLTANKDSKPTIKVPGKYKGYEELLNIDEHCVDDIKLPKGIHSNAMALQYILDHPLIFADNTTKPRAREENKNKVVTLDQDSRTTAVEELGAVLDRMRTHSNTVESNLGDVLNNSKIPRTKKELKEAKKLLKQVQTKYDEVRCESLRSTTIAGEIPKHLSNTIK